jgi:hypothetical protein
MSFKSIFLKKSHLYVKKVFWHYLSYVNYLIVDFNFWYNIFVHSQSDLKAEKYEQF